MWTGRKCFELKAIKLPVTLCRDLPCIVCRRHVCLFPYISRVHWFPMARYGGGFGPQYGNNNYHNSNFGHWGRGSWGGPGYGCPHPVCVGVGLVTADAHARTPPTLAAASVTTLGTPVGRGGGRGFVLRCLEKISSLWIILAAILTSSAAASPIMNVDVALRDNPSGVIWASVPKFITYRPIWNDWAGDIAFPPGSSPEA